jgi:hypothetical protein
MKQAIGIFDSGLGGLTVMKEIHLLMDENHADDNRADDMVVKVANITLDCDLAMPAILRHEPADMDGNAIYNLIPQPSVILPFNCELMATINLFHI